MNNDSTKSPGFTFRLEESENVAFANWALHVADDRPVGVVQELHAYLDNNVPLHEHYVQSSYLRTLSLRAGAAEHLSHLSELDRLVHFWRLAEDV